VNKQQAYRIVHDRLNDSAMRIQIMPQHQSQRRHSQQQPQPAEHRGGGAFDGSNGYLARAVGRLGRDDPPGMGKK
jgi:hypothetical protein